MMKNTKILFGLFAMAMLFGYMGCTKCPKCPEQNSNIVTDDADTTRFMIITDDADTTFFSVAMPAVQRRDSLTKFSIIIDEVDTTRYRIVTDDADAAKKMQFVVNPKPRKPLNTPQQQK